jgi:hypothetical protein
VIQSSGIALLFENYHNREDYDAAAHHCIIRINANLPWMKDEPTHTLPIPGFSSIHGKSGFGGGWKPRYDPQ